MATQTGARSSAYGGFVLFMLVVVYTLNFIDRQIIGILAIPIQEELGVSDTAIGLMRGVSFAIFYSLLGVPIAWVADRANRVWIVTAALTLWSGMTALCGLATNVVQLFLARMGVGIGEAGGVAPSYSIITDYFPPDKRARALAIYSFGIPVGGAIGIVFGGVIATILDWRSAFLIVGLLGVVAAPLFRLAVREPQRGRFDPGAKGENVSILGVFKVLTKKPSFWILSLGAASASIMTYGLLAWLPAFFVRSFGADLPAYLNFLPAWMIPPNAGPVLYASYFYGMILLAGGCLGLFLGGFAADRFGKRYRGAYALVPACAFLCAAPLYVLAVMSPSLTVLFFGILIPTALGLAYAGPVLAAFQHIVPITMRTTATAMFLLINNLIGIGFGDFILGAMSDMLRAQYGDESLRYSILFGVSFYVLAAVLLFAAAPRLKRDWIEAE